MNCIKTDRVELISKLIEVKFPARAARSVRLPVVAQLCTTRMIYCTAQPFQAAGNYIYAYCDVLHLTVTQKSSRHK